MVDKNLYTPIRKIKTLFLGLLILVSLFITVHFWNPPRSSGHSTIAYPMEIFSIWNNTAPTIDGTINFSLGNTSTEWGFAAVYNIYNSSNKLAGKLFLQNNNETFYIGFDGINFITQTPVTVWGVAVYFDLDHDSFLSVSDRAIRFISNSSGTFVEYLKYSTIINQWIIIESGNPGYPLTMSGIKVNTSFSLSSFDNITNHRQYEIKVPFSAISSGPGRTMGIGFEMYNDFIIDSSGATWPYCSTSLHDIRSTAAVYGDISFGEEHKVSFEYIVEKNLNVKSSAIGYNNGTFITSGDIDGDGDLELIVSSNRSVIGDRYLLAIFDYVDGEYQRIWSSWTTAHQSLITFIIEGIVVYDFDEDGKDEIYVCGKSSNILRFSNWNSSSKDFATSEIIFTHTRLLMGYIDIGDANNNGKDNLVFGDQGGYINVLEYNYADDSFSHDARSPLKIRIGPFFPPRIHAIKVGNIDGDIENEVLFNYQTSTDNLLSPTQLLIYQRTISAY